MLATRLDLPAPGEGLRAETDSLSNAPSAPQEKLLGSLLGDTSHAPPTSATDTARVAEAATSGRPSLPASISETKWGSARPGEAGRQLQLLEGLPPLT